MKIALSHNQVIELNLVTDIDKSEGRENIFDFNFEVKYEDTQDDLFYIIFDLKLEHPKDFKLFTKYACVFKTSEKIDTSFKGSDFTIINAPAIAFPFLRSFIATITLNSGFTPAILPSINFMNLKKEGKA
jgi:preprotein translocase subunit SecB